MQTIVGYMTFLTIYILLSLILIIIKKKKEESECDLSYKLLINYFIGVFSVFYKPKKNKRIKKLASILGIVSLIVSISGGVVATAIQNNSIESNDYNIFDKTVKLEEKDIRKINYDKLFDELSLANRINPENAVIRYFSIGFDKNYKIKDLKATVGEFSSGETKAYKGILEGDVIKFDKEEETKSSIEDIQLKESLERFKYVINNIEGTLQNDTIITFNSYKDTYIHLSDDVVTKIVSKDLTNSKVIKKSEKPKKGGKYYQSVEQYDLNNGSIYFYFEVD